MKISLRAGERIYINGAVLRVDRKVSVELVNDVMFLLEGQVMQTSDSTTALRQACDRDHAGPSRLGPDDPRHDRDHPSLS